MLSDSVNLLRSRGQEKEIETYSLSKVILRIFLRCDEGSGVGILNGDKFNLDAGKEFAYCFQGIN